MKSSSEKIQQAVMQTLVTFKSFLPIMFGILLLVSFLNVVARDFYSDVFSGNAVLDPLLGSIAGSISFGIPVTSYIIGGELNKSGVSLLAITAFILAWSTVGVAMLPLEASFLGKRFAIIRNVLNFIFSIIIAFLTVYSLSYL